MHEEIKALHANDNWDLVELPKGRKGHSKQVDLQNPNYWWQTQ